MRLGMMVVVDSNLRVNSELGNYIVTNSKCGNQFHIWKTNGKNNDGYNNDGGKDRYDEGVNKEISTERLIRIQLIIKERKWY